MRDLITPYDPCWKAEFEALRELYTGLLHEYGPDIQHVGSTAVPGLHAKPVLDIDNIIDDERLLPLVSMRLEQAGYEARGDQGIPGRWAFRQDDETVPRTQPRHAWMVHHLYVCLADSLALKNHLFFRDALLADPALAAAYGRFKSELLQRPGMDRETYTRAKTDFILDVLRQAGFTEAEIRAIEAANR